MQLGGLLEKLKGLFTPSFLISTVTPLFCFILINGLILSQFNQSMNQILHDFFALDTAPKTLIGGVFALALIVISYVFSTLNYGLRQVMEGEKLPASLASWLCSSETARLDTLLQEYRKLRLLVWKFSSRSRPWTNELRDARAQGKKAENCVYPENNEVQTALDAIEQLRWRGELIEIADIQQRVDSLKEILAKNSADLSNNPDSRRLDRDQQRLVAIIEYATQRAEHNYIRVLNEKEFNFSRYTIAPTRMGNIAKSVQSYAESRYRMNLVFFWTRLQKIIQSKPDFYKTLQDAKTQLDFTVSLFWLTVVSTAIWLIVLPFLSHTWLPLIGVWLLGPLLARMWYFVGVENYRSFADLLRSSIDLFRFELLGELKVSLPDDSEGERQLWRKLGRRLSYGDEILIPYKQG